MPPLREEPASPARRRRRGRLPGLGLAVTLATALAATLAPAAVRAHGSLHEQLARLDAEIKDRPGDADPLVRRGAAYLAHGDFDAALADFGRATALAPQLDELDRWKGEALLGAGRAIAAKPALDRYLQRHPGDPHALVLRARALRALGAPREAVGDYDRALAARGAPTPDEILERTDAQLEAGQADAALRGLEAAMKRMGPLITLDLKALEIESGAKRWDAALARVDRITAAMPRKETWHLRRAELCTQAGRPADAKRAYAATLDALGALPPHLRHVPAMTELEARAKAGLATADEAARRKSPPPRRPLGQAHKADKTHKASKASKASRASKTD